MRFENCSVDILCARLFCTKPETVSEDRVAVETSVVRVGHLHRACITLRYQRKIFISTIVPQENGVVAEIWMVDDFLGNRVSHV